MQIFIHHTCTPRFSIDVGYGEMNHGSQPPTFPRLHLLRTCTRENRVRNNLIFTIFLCFPPEEKPLSRGWENEKRFVCEGFFFLLGATDTDLRFDSRLSRFSYLFIYIYVCFLWRLDLLAENRENIHTFLPPPLMLESRWRRSFVFVFRESKPVVERCLLSCFLFFRRFNSLEIFEMQTRTPIALFDLRSTQSHPTFNIDQSTKLMYISRNTIFSLRDAVL